MGIMTSQDRWKVTEECYPDFKDELPALTDEEEEEVVEPPAPPDVPPRALR